MKKKIYIICLAVITICCIIGGTIYHTLGFLDVLSELRNPGSESEWNSERVTEFTKLTPFQDVSIDGSVLDITMETGDDFSISYDCASNLVPEIAVENGTLTVTQPDTQLNFHFGINISSAKDYSCNMTLTIPADVVLNDLDVYTDVGEIAISGIAASSATIQSDVGDLDIRKCTFERADLVSDVGDIDIAECALGEASSYADVGNVSLDSCSFTNLDTSCDVGDISIDTYIDLSGCYIDLSSDVGEVLVNGKKFDKNFHQQSSGNSGKCSLTAEAGTGDISLTY